MKIAYTAACLFALPSFGFSDTITWVDLQNVFIQSDTLRNVLLDFARGEVETSGTTYTVNASRTMMLKSVTGSAIQSPPTWHPDISSLVVPPTTFNDSVSGVYVNPASLTLRWLFTERMTSQSFQKYINGVPDSEVINRYGNEAVSPNLQVVVTY